VSVVLGFCRMGKRCAYVRAGRCERIHPEHLENDPALSPWVKHVALDLALSHPAEGAFEFPVTKVLFPEEKAWHSTTLATARRIPVDVRIAQRAAEPAVAAGQDAEQLQRVASFDSSRYARAVSIAGRAMPIDPVMSPPHTSPVGRSGRGETGSVAGVLTALSACPRSLTTGRPKKRSTSSIAR
jgi:hypothetical protein